MRIPKLIVASFLVAAVVTTVSPTRAAEPSSIAHYVNGHWWTGRGFAAGERCIGDGVFVRCPTEPAGQTIDLAGGHVIPPLADAHNHVTSDTRRAIAAGVFYLMNPTVLASVVPQRRPTPGEIDVAHSMGAITSPGGHPEALYQDILRPNVYPDKRPGDFVGDAFHYVVTADDIAPVLDRLQSQNADFIKIVVFHSEEFALRRDDPAFRGQRGIDPALVAPLVREAHRRGLRVAAHIESAADFRVIVAAGVDVAVHLPGYYVGAIPIDRYAITDGDAQAAARAGMSVVATASLALNNPDATMLPATQAMQRDNLRRLVRARVPLLIGTDALPDAAITEAGYLVSLGVLTPRAALNALTGATPAFIFPGRQIGRLETGYEASFLVLDRDPTRDLASLPSSIVRRVKQGVALDPPP